MSLSPFERPQDPASTSARPALRDLALHGETLGHIATEQCLLLRPQVRHAEQKAKLWQAAAEHAEQKAKAAGSEEVASRIASLEVGAHGEAPWRNVLMLNTTYTRMPCCAIATLARLRASPSRRK